jgi:ABC-type multidrug transport system ATPase subunit
MNPKVNPGEIVAALRDVTVTFDGYATRALSRVNLEVRRGEILGVLGPKGAGKSTLLKVLAGKLRPTEGKVKLFGGSARGNRSRVGYLAEVSDSTRPSGFFGRLFFKRSVPLQVPRAALRLTQAVVGNRDLLVLDEPFAGLSNAEKAEVETMVRELAARGKTVIISGDLLPDIRNSCGRFAMLFEGKLQATGTLAELLAGETAVRLFPAVMGRDAVDRLLKVLKEEILGESVAVVAADSPKSAANASLAPTALVSPSDTETRSPAVDDSVDHKRLESLTRPEKLK